METLFRLIFHTLKRNRYSTILNLIGLSVAFAAFTIIVMEVQDELKFDRHYPDSDRIYQVDFSTDEEKNEFGGSFSRLHAEQVLSLSPSLESSAFAKMLYEETQVYATESTEKTPTKEKIIATSDSLWHVFGLTLLAGDFGQYNRPKTALISESSAIKVMGTRDVIGKRLTFTNGNVTDTAEIVALFKDLNVNSTIPNGIHINIGNEHRNINESFFSVYLKVRPGTNIANLEALFQDGGSDMIPFKEQGKTGKYAVTNLHERMFRPEFKSGKQGNKVTIYSLLSVGFLIILIAIVNFINFSMALVPKRIKSINTQKVLGASVGKLRFQQITESTGTAIIASLFSFIWVYLISLTSFSKVVGTEISLMQHADLIGMVLGLAALTGIIAGLYPAVYSTSFTPALILKGSFGLSVKGRKLRTLLIGFQYVISIGLIVVTLFIWLQYNYMRDFDKGIKTENILTTRLTHDMEQRKTVITDRLKSHPDIDDVAYSMFPAFGDGSSYHSMGFNFKEDRVNFNFVPVSYNFLSMMNIPIVEGRDFEKTDENKPDGCYILNEAAHKETPLELGDQLPDYRLGEQRSAAAVVGIARNFNYKPLHSPIEPFAFYLPFDDFNMPLLYTYVKLTNPNTKSAVDFVKSTLLDIDPTAVNTLQMEFVDETITSAYKKESNLAFLITAFSVLAILISTIGIFGLIMFETQYRRREIGVRKVFGATVNEILTMFNKSYLKIVGVCFVLSSPVAYYIVKSWLEGFSYRTPMHIWVYFTGLLIISIITTLTVTLQGYRAAVENPANSIKAD